MNGARRAGPTPRGRVSGGGSGGTQREGQNPGTGGCRDTLEGRKIVLRGSGEDDFQGDGQFCRGWRERRTLHRVRPQGHDNGSVLNPMKTYFSRTVTPSFGLGEAHLHALQSRVRTWPVGQ